MIGPRTGLALTALLLAAPASAGETVERRASAMGTSLVLTVEAPDRASALAASEGALRAVEAAEERLSTWRSGSALSRALVEDDAGPVRLEPALAEDLEAALACAGRTGGAFDPTVGPLVAAWELRSGGRLPADAEIEAALARVGHGRVRLEGRRFGPHGPDLVLEEGGFGKGAALDDALEAVRKAGGHRARLDLGGQVSLLAGGSVRLAHPRERARAVVSLELPAGSLATTGNGERGIRIDGRAYGHVLDPRTGRPAADFGSVSVFAPGGLEADCLSTGLYVLGPEAALRFAARHPGIEVLVLDLRGERPVARVSAGLRERVRVLDPGWRLEGDPR